jgi:hypothetical protein
VNDMTSAGALRLTIDGEEVTLVGTVKGDPAHQQIAARPWVWSPRARAYVLPRSLKPLTRTSRIAWTVQSAQRLGVLLEVEDSGVRQSEAERRAAGTERLEIRADLHAAAADRHSASSDAAADAARVIADAIPMGQPILVGHHSERRHRRDLERLERNDRRAWAEQAEAERRRRLAEGIRRHLDNGTPAVTLHRRIERHGAEIRRIERMLDRHPAGTYPDHEAEAERLREAVQIDRDTLARMVADGRARVFVPGDVEKGGAVASRVWGWGRVVRVNAKSVTVFFASDDPGWSRTVAVPYREIVDVRPASAESGGTS